MTNRDETNPDGVKPKVSEAEVLGRLVTVKEHDKAERKHQMYLVAAFMLVLVFGALVYVAYMLAQDAENRLPEPSQSAYGTLRPASYSDALDANAMIVHSDEIEVM